MVKKGLTVLTALMVSLLIWVTGYSQEDMQVVDNAVFDEPTRPPAVFVHDEHNEAAGIDECNPCHHVYENGVRLEDESSEDQSCSECHPVERGDGPLRLMNAFHQNCKECHRLGKTGPVMCGECHKK